MLPIEASLAWFLEVCEVFLAGADGIVSGFDLGRSSVAEGTADGLVDSGVYAARATALW